MIESARESNPLPLLLAIADAALTDPHNPDYLPVLVAAQHSPQLEPYEAGDWNPGALQDPAEDASLACGQCMAVPETTPTVALANVEIAGFSNAALQSLAPDSDPNKPHSFNASIAFGTLTDPSYPAHLTISGGFQVSQLCCTANDQWSDCAGPRTAVVGTGTFAAVLVTATLAADMTLGVAPDGSFDVSVDSLTLATSPDASNLTVTATMTGIQSVGSCTGADTTLWTRFVASLFDSDQGRTMIVKQMQAMLADPTILEQLARGITELVQSLLRPSA